MQLSAESKLLVENWDAYQDILTAAKKLQTDIGSSLIKAGEQFASEREPKGSWRCKGKGVDQIYIYHENWVRNEQSLVWIGVEGFTPESLFGTNSAQLYVWVPEGRRDIADNLREKLKAMDKEIHGKVSSNNNCYVVTAPVPCLSSESPDDLLATPIEEVLKFFRYYIEHESVISEAIEESITSPTP